MWLVEIISRGAWSSNFFQWTGWRDGEIRMERGWATERAVEAMIVLCPAFSPRMERAHAFGAL